MEPQELEKYFGVADFAVFFASLVLSALIGVYFGFKDKNKKSVDTYYFGDGSVSTIAVSMSMTVSFISAITVLGYPVETYFYGISFLWVIVSAALATIFATIYFVPLIFQLRMTSMYQYLELRYSRVIRRLCSFIVMIQLSLYIGNTIYLPALALTSVTPLDLEWSIGLTSLVCTFYTTLGGVKAVIWTDVLQSFIMVFGALALFVRATMDIGGIGTLMETASSGERFNFFNFDPDIRLRTNAVAYFVGFFVLYANRACFSQICAQRYLSCKSVTAAKKASMLRIIPTTIFTIIAALDGLAMYAYYEGCDPYKAGYIKRKDQLTSRFAVEVFHTLPGLAGLFVAAAYSGALSTVSSGINSLSAMATEDFILPCWPRMTASRRTLTAKICSLLFGSMVTVVAYLVSRLQATVLQICMALAGIFAGPMFAVFLLGTMCPWINEKGAFGGIILGSAFAAWCSFGRIFNGIAAEFQETLPTSIEECYTNSTSMTATTYEVFNMTTVAQSTEYRSPLVNLLYSISPFLNSFFGFLVGSIFMIIISGATGFNKPSELNPKLFVPLIDNKKIFPKRVVKFFRFGVPELAEESQREEFVHLQGDAKSIRA